MPSRSFQKEVFTNKSRLQNIKKTNNKRYINGELVTVNSKSFKIQNAAQILKQNNSFNKQSSNTDTASVSLEVLAAIGVTPIYNQERDYSFLKIQDVSPLRNPNIIETDRLKDLKNKNIDARDKFKNKENPFYNLDEGMSQNKQDQIKQIKEASRAIDATNLAAAFFDLNIVTTNTPSIRQFR